MADFLAPLILIAVVSVAMFLLAAITGMEAGMALLVLLVTVPLAGLIVAGFVALLTSKQGGSYHSYEKRDNQPPPKTELEKVKEKAVELLVRYEFDIDENEKEEIETILAETYFVKKVENHEKLLDKLLEIKKRAERKRSKVEQECRQKAAKLVNGEIRMKDYEISDLLHKWGLALGDSWVDDELYGKVLFFSNKSK